MVPVAISEGGRLAPPAPPGTSEPDDGGVAGADVVPPVDGVPVFDPGGLVDVVDPGGFADAVEPGGFVAPVDPGGAAVEPGGLAGGAFELVAPDDGVSGIVDGGSGLAVPLLNSQTQAIVTCDSESGWSGPTCAFAS